MEETLSQYVDKIIEDGIITTEEHEQFMKLVHADGKIDEEESAQLSRIFQLISSGKVKVVDKERDNVDREKLEAAKNELLQAEEEDRKKHEELHAAQIAKNPTNCTRTKGRSMLSTMTPLQPDTTKWPPSWPGKERSRSSRNTWDNSLCIPDVNKFW